MIFMTFHILGTWELIIPMILLRVIHLKVCDMGTWLPIVVIIIRLLIYQQYICWIYSLTTIISHESTFWFMDPIFYIVISHYIP